MTDEKEVNAELMRVSPQTGPHREPKGKKAVAPAPAPAPEKKAIVDDRKGGK